MERWSGVRCVDEARVRAGSGAPLPGDDEAPRTCGIDGLVPSSDSARLALVAQHTDDAIVIYRPDGRIDWVNDAFVRMTGFGVEEAVGSYRLDLVRGPFTRTPQFVELARDLIELRNASAEFVTRTRDGVSYWVAMEVRLAVQDGRVVGKVGVERDITRRRQAEERARQGLHRAESLGVALRHEKMLLTAVLATIPHLVWWKNSDLRYVGANQAYLTFRGLSSVAELVGRLDGQLDRGDTVGDTFGELERTVLAGRRPITDHTVSLALPDGRQGRFLVSVLPYHEGLQFAGVIGIGADVSRVADLERQVAQASRLESIGQLAAGIAHEINTPVQYVSDNTRFVADTVGDVITGLHDVAGLADDGTLDADHLRGRLKGLLERLDLEFVADEVPSALTQSLEGLERVGAIVRAMKDFSHPGRGRADVDLNRVVQTTAQVSRNEWKYVAQLELDCARDVGRVPCYEGELKQVLLNVIVNAAQSIAERLEREKVPGPGSILVTTQRRGEEVLISVRDDGIGMDEDTRARVFDPFFTTKKVGQGTGQGMSLAHTTVVQKHGGRIEIESAPGKGATVTVVLPLNPPPDAGEAMSVYAVPVVRDVRSAEEAMG